MDPVQIKKNEKQLRVDLSPDLVALIDKKFALKFGSGPQMAGKYAKKIKKLLDTISDQMEAPKSEDQVKTVQSAPSTPPPTSALNHNHSRSNCYKPMNQWGRYYCKKRLEEIFEEMDADLGKYYSTTMAQLLTLLAQRDPKRAEELVSAIDNGKLVQKLVQKEIAPKEKLIVSPDRALLSKDEGLISDEIFRSFIIECGISTLFPSLESIKKRRQKLNAEIEQKLHITEMTNLPDGNTGYECDVNEVIKLMLSTVEAFAPEQQIPDQLEFKISLDGRLLHGKKDVLIGLIPLNLGFVVQNQYNVWPLAIFSGSEKFDYLNIALANLNRQLASLRQNGLQWKGKDLRISTKVIVDLAAFWALSDELAYNIISNVDPEFCPYCYAKCSQRAKLDIRRRRSLPLLLDCLPKDFIFCALHMRMRITERLIQMLAHSLKMV